MSILQEFKDFIKTGSVFQTAVGLVMALAFVPVVDALVDGVILQIVAGIFTEQPFTTLTLEFWKFTIYYGTVISAVLNFLVIAAVVFVLVKIYNTVMKVEKTVDGPSEVDLLIEIRDTLRHQQR